MHAAYETTQRPEGSPPTRAEHTVLSEAFGRPLTDSPTGTHIHTWARRRRVPVSPDILRRAGIRVHGERTPEQAALILAARVISHVLDVTIGEANRMIRETAAA